MSSDKWIEIWNRRNLSGQQISTLQNLIYLDGFDSGAGKINEQDWAQYIHYIRDIIGIRETDSLFEVGCGSGAFLYLFFVEGHKVGGIDYSEPLIQKAKSTFTAMDFSLNEASLLSTAEKYSVVISNGVFHYFPNFDYAQKVMEKMLSKAQKKIAILEVPDEALKTESENARRGMLPPEEYDKKYKGLEHMYFQREWFEKFALKHGCKCSISNQNINKYGNNHYRFNCILEKTI